MSLSTNSVFHFTRNIEAIQGILENNFRIKYCIERIESKNRTIEYAVPMVSFCDIPLSQVISHIDKYGGYGVGLFKKWAKVKGLNPVLYLEKNATLLNKGLIREKFENSDNQLVQEFLKYTKNYEGQLIRNNEVVQKRYRFYDEREWRYCPDGNLIKEAQPIIHDVHAYTEDKVFYNNRLSHIKLNFTLKDISYVIVQDENEIMGIVDYFDELFRSTKQKDYIKIFATKIITSKQIRTDF